MSPSAVGGLIRRESSLSVSSLEVLSELGSRMDLFLLTLMAALLDGVDRCVCVCVCV